MCNELESNTDKLIECLNHADVKDIKAVIGLDGFVDQILHVVDIRENAEQYSRIATLREYGERIAKAAGLSTNVEVVPVNVKLGGNGPILCNSLVTYGMSVTYIGALGYPDIHPVFKPMGENAVLLSIADPSQTDAYEFEDGKLIVSRLEPFKAICWDTIKGKIGVDNMISMVREARIFGLENWTMVPYMSDIWRHILDEVMPFVGVTEEKNFIFFDLADPEKRTKKDIMEAFALIQEFSAYFKVVLGLNQKELFEAAEVLGFDDTCSTDSGAADVRGMVEKVAKKLGIYCLVVHPVAEAMAYSEGIYYHTVGPYTAYPLITTGAGDNFNAGFCTGQVLGLSVQLSLVLGVATSGYYVRNKKSPTMKSLIVFLKQWREGHI